jgi:preprotein translocase subunit SecG
MLLTILLVVIIFVAVAMVGVILMQRSEGGALGMSGGGPGNFMTARGTGDLLSRTTQILAAVFFVLCLGMTLLGGREHARNSIASRLNIGSITPQTLNTQPQPAQQAPASSAPPAQFMPAPAAPPSQPGKSNPLDLFGQGGQSKGQ